MQKNQQCSITSCPNAPNVDTNSLRESEPTSAQTSSVGRAGFAVAAALSACTDGRDELPLRPWGQHACGRVCTLMFLHGTGQPDHVLMEANSGK